MWKFLVNLFQLLLSPGHGWEDISASSTDYHRTLSSGFYPLTALTSVSVFVTGIYHDSLTLPQLLTGAIVTFVTYFIGYFISAFILSLFLQPNISGEMNEQRYHTFVINTFGLLELIRIVGNCVPVPLSILFFLPVYVAIIMWKGTRYMGVRPDRTGQFMVLCVCGVLLVPYILSFVFNLIMP